jgi:hypothetical protein
VIVFHFTIPCDELKELASNVNSDNCGAIFSAMDICLDLNNLGRQHSIIKLDAEDLWSIILRLLNPCFIVFDPIFFYLNKPIV